MVERQSIGFMALPLQAANAIFGQVASVSRATKVSRNPFPQVIPAFHRRGGLVEGDRSTGPVDISVENPDAARGRAARVLRLNGFA